MKTIYRATNHIVTIYFKDGTSISKDFADCCHGRFTYQYGELLPNTREEYLGTEDEVWAALLRRINYCDSAYQGKLTLFTRRRYLPEVCIDLLWINRRIYKDELLKFTIEKIYKDCSDDLPSIEILEKDLGFKDYSEFVFMREQELKSMLLKNN